MPRPRPSASSAGGSGSDFDGGEFGEGAAENGTVDLTDDDENAEVVTLDQIEVEHPERVSFGMKGLNRVLGCNRGTQGPYGAFRGGCYMLKAGPGVGKSTLTLQICVYLVKKGFHVLYATGEQSKSDLKIVTNALKKLTKREQKRFHVVMTQSTDRVIWAVEKYKPLLAVMDSVQMFKSKNVEGGAASEPQCHYIHHELVVGVCKPLGTISWLISQVTKSGEFRGPNTLAHLADADLLMKREGEDEDDETVQTRALVAETKNRGGQAGIIARMLMTDCGLVGLKTKLIIKIPKRSRQTRRRRS
jgi:DNA repair protein RadA/Sms